VFGSGFLLLLVIAQLSPGLNENKNKNEGSSKNTKIK
jgi:hypothetical protein